jgi:hypothetical protein
VVRGSSFRAHTNCNVWFGGAVGLSEGVQLAQQRDMNARAEDAIDANVGESQSLLVMNAFISHLDAIKSKVDDGLHVALVVQKPVRFPAATRALAPG